MSPLSPAILPPDPKLRHCPQGYRAGIRIVQPPNRASRFAFVRGLFVTPSYTGVSTSYGPTATPPTNPVTYTVTATVVDPNYIGMATNALTINQLSPVVSRAKVRESLHKRITQHCNLLV